jgi:hypothetical protein
MGNLTRVKRVDTGDGDWIDLRPLSVEEARAMQKAAREAKVEDGESQDEAAGYALLAAVRERIVAWSDDVPVSPENVVRLPVDLNTQIMHALLEVSDLPLLTGSPSTDTSTE